MIHMQKHAGRRRERASFIFDSREVKSLKNIYYKKLRELMAKYLLDKKDIAEIIGKSYRQTLKILKHEVSEASGEPFEFSLTEAVILTKHFRQLGETDITIDTLFFNDVFSNENVSNF